MEPEDDIKIEPCERWVEWISGDGPAHRQYGNTGAMNGGWWTAAGDWELEHLFSLFGLELRIRVGKRSCRRLGSPLVCRQGVEHAKALA